MTAVPRLSQVQAHYCHRQRPMVLRCAALQRSSTSGRSTGHCWPDWNYPTIPFVLCICFLLEANLRLCYACKVMGFRNLSQPHILPTFLESIGRLDLIFNSLDYRYCTVTLTQVEEARGKRQHLIIYVHSSPPGPFVALPNSSVAKMFTLWNVFHLQWKSHLEVNCLWPTGASLPSQFSGCSTLLFLSASGTLFSITVWLDSSKAGETF